PQYEPDLSGLGHYLYFGLAGGGAGKPGPGADDLPDDYAVRYFPADLERFCAACFVYRADLQHGHAAVALAAARGLAAVEGIAGGADPAPEPVNLCRAGP